MKAIENFAFEGKMTECRPYGSGHINDTYLLSYEIGVMGRIKVILQRMNGEVFEKPEELMENNCKCGIIPERKDCRKRGRSGEGDSECNTDKRWQLLL